MEVGLVRSLQPPDILWIHWRVYNFIANTSKQVLFLPPSDAYVRSFLYLLYTLIKLYYTKALSNQASSLAPDWILLLWGPRIPVSSRDSTTTFHHYGEQYGDSSKNLKIELPYDPAIPLLNIRRKWIVVAVQLLSHVQLFATPRTAARQASLSITISWSLLKIMSIKLVMSSNHLILCHPLLLLAYIFPNIRVFFNKSTLCIRWAKCWSFSFSISPSSEYSGLISFRRDWFDLLAV